MRWSILIASHSTRSDPLITLAESLAPQLTPNVEVVVLWNRGRRALGEYRQALVDDARGEYVSHVDDDDRIPDYFVSDMLEAMTEDYVGFEVELTDIAGQIGPKGRKYRAVHSLKNDRWHQKGDVFYRHVSHLNPIRRELAKKAGWVGHYSEDHRWADEVRPFVRTEVFIPKTMYFYDFDHRLSLRGQNVDNSRTTRPVLPDGFRYHPESEE